MVCTWMGDWGCYPEEDCGKPLLFISCLECLMEKVAMSWLQFGGTSFFFFILCDWPSELPGLSFKPRSTQFLHTTHSISLQMKLPYSEADH